MYSDKACLVPKDYLMLFTDTEVHTSIFPGGKYIFNFSGLSIIKNPETSVAGQEHKPKKKKPIHRFPLIKPYFSSNLLYSSAKLIFL